VTEVPPKPVFIVGVGRSGTTLMRAMLNAHPAFAIAPETHFLDNIAPRWRRRDLSDRDVHAQLIAELAATKKVRRLARDHVDAALATVPPGPHAVREAMAAVLAAHGRQHGNPRWGEKTPRHFRFIATLFEWFPGAQVVWMVRDPRAVTASRLKTRWASPYLHRNARAWNQAARLAIRWRADQRVHVVRYESLAGSPEDVARALCAFLGEPYVPEMLSHDEVARLATAQTSFRAAADTGGRAGGAPAISSTPAERWRQAVPAYEVQAIERLCGPAMRRLGYQPIHRRAGLHARFHILSSKVRYAPRGVRRLLNAQRVKRRGAGST